VNCQRSPKGLKCLERKPTPNGCLEIAYVRDGLLEYLGTAQELEDFFTVSGRGGCHMSSMIVPYGIARNGRKQKKLGTLDRVPYVRVLRGDLREVKGMCRPSPVTRWIS
jgi:hypothetical protein